MIKTLCGAVATAALFTAPALAQEAFPALSGEVAMELQHDHVSGADNADTEGQDTYVTIEPTLVLALSRAFRLEAGLTLEPVQDRDPGNDRLMDDHGLYVGTLQAVYEGDGIALTAGKFTAPFGLAHDRIPGLYGDTFSEGYELTERLGAGVGADVAVRDAAIVSLAAALFKRDTTVLSRSVITDRGDLDYEDGGSGNTKGLRNLSLTAGIGEVAAAPGLAVQASYLRQGKGDGDLEGTSAWGLGAAWELPLGGAVTVTPLVEYVKADETTAVNEATYIDGATQSTLTGGVGLGYRNWSAALTGGKRTAKEPGNPDVKDSFVQVSAGYAFDNGIGVEAGWMSLEEDDEESSTLGLMVSYGLEF